MDAARAADASDPDRNYHFSRRWSEKPSKAAFFRPIQATEKARKEIGAHAGEIQRVFARFADLAEVVG